VLGGRGVEYIADAGKMIYSRDMNSYTPAADQKELQRKLDAINKCGKNMGPHDYIPIEWTYTSLLDGKIIEGLSFKRVTKMMCRTCFVYIEVSTLMKMYGEVKL
jgi:hypothetical protein